MTFSSNIYLLSEVNSYFTNKSSELSNDNIINTIAAETIIPLYYISANDYLSEIYINIINNIYYDDLVDKKCRTIGYLFYEHVNDSNSINESNIRNIIESTILTYDSVHNLGSKDTYIKSWISLCQLCI